MLSYSCSSENSTGFDFPRVVSVAPSKLSMAYQQLPLYACTIYDNTISRFSCDTRKCEQKITT